jgi:hypothetical protein
MIRFFAKEAQNDRSFPTPSWEGDKGGGSFPHEPTKDLIHMTRFRGGWPYKIVKNHIGYSVNNHTCLYNKPHSLPQLRRRILASACCGKFLLRLVIASSFEPVPSKQDMAISPFTWHHKLFCVKISPFTWSRKRLLRPHRQSKIRQSPTSFPITYHLPPTTYHLSPTTYHLSPTTYHLSPTPYHPPPTTYHQPPITYPLSPRAIASK